MSLKRISHIFDTCMSLCGSTVMSTVHICLPAVEAEKGPGPEWSDEEGPRGFWVTMSVSSGTLM